MSDERIELALRGPLPSPLTEEELRAVRGEQEPWKAVPVRVFAAVDEPGAEALVGDDENALGPSGGDVMVYGDGGVGKTTLCIDLACHLAAGDDWLGIPIRRAVRVLMIENEGPRPRLRKKLRRKLDCWEGSPIGDRLLVFERPWARVTFADQASRGKLAELIRTLEVDVVIVGPITRAGMNDAGTLQEVREFTELVADARRRSGRPVMFVLVHHENKGGQVSGAWEASGDTLLHVQGQGHGRTRLFVQKARWDSHRHGTSLQLVWADGEGFTVEEAPELDDDTIAEQILAVIGENPGTGWTRVEEATPGVSKQRRREIRDRLLRDRRVVNVSRGGDGEQVVLDECPERKKARLYLATDPTITHLRPDPGADGAQTAPAPAGSDQLRLRPAPALKKGAGVGAADFPPSETTEEKPR